MSEPLLEANGLGRTFREGGRSLVVLDGVDFTVDDGECVAILGRSGSGKSTLLHLLGGLDRPTAGVVRFRGRDVYAMNELAIDRYRNRDVGFVFQQYHLLPELSALENVRIASQIGRPRHRKRDGDTETRSTSPRERAEALLARVGLGDRLRHKPSKLSGGERPRVAIARGLMHDPAVLLADEPTGNLDADTGASVLELFAELHREGQAMVLVTHDQNVAQQADRVVTLVGGMLAPTPGSAAATV